MNEGLRNKILFVTLVIVYILFMTSNSILMIHVERPFEKKWRERMKQLKSHYESQECVDSKQFEGTCFLFSFSWAFPGSPLPG